MATLAASVADNGKVSMGAALRLITAPKNLPIRK